MDEDVDRLDAAGRALWDRVVDENDDLDAVQEVMLLQAARSFDMLRRLESALTEPDDRTVPLDRVAREVAASARALAQLLRSLRLADPVTGRRPQRRGPRGVYAPRAPKL